MMEFIGGYLFIPKDNRQQSELINLTLNIMSGSDKVVRVKLQDGQWLPMSVDASLAELYKVLQGTVELSMFGFLGRVTFETNVSGYNVIGIMVAEGDFLDSSASIRLDQFRSHWILLCQKTLAEFGYFGNYPYEIEKSYRDEKILVPLLCNEIEYLVEKAFWLTYLSSKIALQWRAHIHGIPGFVREVQTLSSGALVLHAGRGDNPISGD